MFVASNQSAQSLPQQNEVFRVLHGQDGVRLMDSAELGRDLALAHWLRSPPEDQADYHGPELHTLSFYVDGGYRTRRRDLPFCESGAPDKLCLMPAGEDASWQIGGPIEFIHLYFSESRLAELGLRCFDLDPRLLELQPVTYGDDPRLAQLFRQLVQPLDWQDRADRMALSQLGDTVLMHLLRHYSGRKPVQEALRGGLAKHLRQRVEEYVEARLDQPLTLAELAGVAGLSEYHFARMFKRSSGQAPHQYVLSRRLARANDLLRHSQLPIAQIAATCGFSSQSHLTRRFRAAYGTTPGALRCAYPAES